MMTSNPSEIVELHAFVYGKVQGVGFRATTRYYAKQLGLNGSVTNLADGRVEIIAQGTRSKLEELLVLLKSHKSIIRIDDIHTNFFSPRSSFTDFS